MKEIVYKGEISDKKRELFFREQNRAIEKLINNLVDFRTDTEIDQTEEIKEFFKSVKVKSCDLGYYELSKIGEQYENYIDAIVNINESSHKFFSDILKGAGIIKKNIRQLEIKINHNKLNYMDIECKIESSFEKGNILLLDDDRLISAILKDAFEKEGYNIMTTDDHEEAIEHILYEGIDIALIDIVMPKKSGFEVFEILKSNGLDIPIIFLSGQSTINYKVKALSKGVDDYITKPFEIKEVIARVERSLWRSNQYKNRINKDKLTGAYTKQFFSEYICDILEQKRYLKQEFSVAFLDLDDFKYINDNYGHIVGDYALMDFANFLKENLKESDIIFRFGGDEFIVLFVGKSIIKSYKCLENMREKLNETTFKYKGAKQEIKLKVSIGITEIKEYDSVEEILNRADKCLYNSKRLGKNTTVCCSQINKEQSRST